MLTTYNKLSYLKEVMIALLENCNQDEELVVIDGGSTDGTVDYLQNLYNDGKINQFVSEKDYGEAHGFNKGILMAKGELIKLISDDDVFDFEVLKHCKNYLLSKKSVDVLYANITSINSSGNGKGELIFAKSYEEWFKNWKNGLTKNCFICGLSFLARRSAIPYIGVFDTSFKHVDFEYSVRITSKKINIAFYTGLMVAAVINVDSVSYVSGDLVNKEIKRVSDYYDYTYPIGAKPHDKIVKNKTLQSKIISKFKPEEKPAVEYYLDYNFTLKKNMDTSDFSLLYKSLSKIMKEYNVANKPEFIENIKY